MSQTRPPLATWTAALRRLLDDCPYVGPRPQTAADKDMLIGRSDDVLRVRRAVLNRRLVILHGYSGSGKTSLLQNGLLDALDEAGFNVFVSRSWPNVEESLKGSSLSDMAEVESYIARGIKESEHDPATEIGSARSIDLESIAKDGTLLRTLDDSFDGKAVLVLDQFEELLRNQENSAREIVQWILWSGRRHRTRIVVSLRTDSLHYLDPLLRGIKPFTVDRVGISELTDVRSIQSVIRKSRADSDSDPIDPDAVSRLMKLWNHSHPSLLHLQATLYSLFFRSQDRSRRAGMTARAPITLKDVTELEDASEDVFAFGLSESLRLKIEHAHKAARTNGLDDYLITGTREIVRRSAPLLSSGDFKVPVDQVELARRVLARELAVLHRELVIELGLQAAPRAALAVREVVDSLFRELLTQPDVLTSRFKDVAPLLQRSTPASPSGLRPELGRRADVTSGPMMSKSAVETLYEELRRVAFSIQWLISTQIVRKDWDGVLTLVHDGSGSALREWADVHAEELRQALRQITGARGEDYVWADQEIGGDDPAVIANLSWRDCRITSRFRNVVFVNCDFRGSRFESCRFEGVTFVNCLLDDTNFEYCEIVGEARLHRVKRKDPSAGRKVLLDAPDQDQREKTTGQARVAPSFLVRAHAREVEMFSPYLEPADEQPSGFFSDTSGKAAFPGRPPREHLTDVFALAHDGEDWQAGEISENIPPVRGGIAMLGGRLCFLTLYRCKSREGGSFAFHHVSGDGLDLVEQYGGTVVIHDGAVRGISVSRDPQQFPVSRRTESAPPESAPPLTLEVYDSLVTHLYFSDELKGSVTFDNSVVFMLINASENSEEGFEVVLKSCRFQCLVNTHEPEEESPEHSGLDEKTTYFRPIPPSDSRFQAPNRRSLAIDLETMDYRSSPDQWEEMQRERKAASRSTEDGSVTQEEGAP